MRTYYPLWLTTCLLLLLTGCHVTAPGRLVEVAITILPDASQSNPSQVSAEAGESTQAQGTPPTDGNAIPVPQRFIALTAISATVASANADTTLSYLLPVSRIEAPSNRFTLEEFQPPGKIRLAIMRLIPANVVPMGLTPETVGDWYLFVPNELPDAPWQSWEQVVLTPTTSILPVASIGSAPTALYSASMRRTIQPQHLIRFEPQQPDQVNQWPQAILNTAAELKVSHPDQRLWADLLLVEQPDAAGQPELVLYTFVNDGENPDGPQGQVYYCRRILVCGGSSSVWGRIRCWWNRCW